MGHQLPASKTAYQEVPGNTNFTPQSIAKGDKTLHVFSSAFHAVFPWQLATVSSHCNGAHSISMTQVGKLSRLLESCLQMGNVDNWPLVRDGKKIPLHLLTISMTSAVIGMAIVTTETGPRTTDVARWIAKLTNLPIQWNFLKRIILFLMARRALFQHPIKGSYNWNPVWFFRFQSLIKTHRNSPVQYRQGNRCVLTSRNNKEYYNRCATQPMLKHCYVQRICIVLTHTQIFSDLYMSASLLTKPEH